MLICEKKIFHYCTFVLGIARHTFNCFQIIFLFAFILFIYCWLSSRCKTIFSFEFANERMTFSASFSRSKECDWRLLGFKCGFWQAQTLTAEINSKAEKQNNVFGCNFASGTIFQKVILFPALLRTFNCLYVWALTYLQSKIELNSENIMDGVRCDFARERQCHKKNHLYRMYFRFRNCSRKV